MIEHLMIFGKGFVALALLLLICLGAIAGVDKYPRVIFTVLLIFGFSLLAYYIGQELS